jgi:hypothetical protein
LKESYSITQVDFLGDPPVSTFQVLGWPTGATRSGHDCFLWWLLQSCWLTCGEELVAMHLCSGQEERESPCGSVP